MYSQSRRNRNAVNVWPGFVDALASVLLVFIFMLLLFVVGQFFLTDILMGRNEELFRLNQDMDVLSGSLIVEKHKTATQRKRIDELNKSLKSILMERDRINQELGLKLREIASLQEDIAALRIFRKEMEEKISVMALTLERQEKQLQQASEQSAKDRQTISANEKDLAELMALRDKLSAEVADLTIAITLNQDELTAVRDRSKSLAQRLSDEEERTRLAQEQIDKKDIRLQELRELLASVDQALAEEKHLSAEKQEQLSENAKTQSLQQAEIEALRTKLDLSSTQVSQQQTELDRLNIELNRELASKVKELSRYRSEFFGRLRDVLGDHPDIRVIGDRFLFQSELLFASGSAVLGAPGRQQLKKLAATLKEVSGKIPEDINWILRVDGHTDKNPINTGQFPSNWELSTARALSIVNFLIAEGIEPSRLAATGFAEFHPLDNAENEAAYSRNRRIELKLTER